MGLRLSVFRVEMAELKTTKTVMMLTHSTETAVPILAKFKLDTNVQKLLLDASENNFVGTDW